MSNSIRIALVDDDEAVVDSLCLYLSMHGIDVQAFARADAFLGSLAADSAYDCIVSDIRMPGVTGLQLQQQLNARGSHIPLILITGHGAVEEAVTAFKAGAFDFIEKPFAQERLTQSIRSAAAGAQHQRTSEREFEELAARVATLSERQRQVMDFAVNGFTNKEIAAKLQISPRTVETYRTWVMERTGARNLAELVRFAMRLERKQ